MLGFMMGEMVYSILDLGILVTFHLTPWLFLQSRGDRQTAITDQRSNAPVATNSSWETALYQVQYVQEQKGLEFDSNPKKSKE